MRKEDKELLIRDLCVRIPYRVKVHNTTFKDPTIQILYGRISENEFMMEESYTNVGIDGDDLGSFNKRHYTGYVDFIKPYLRSMSSMTEEERNEFYCNLRPKYDGKPWESMGAEVDWLNTHHFDYRGLIEKGLALEAPEGMYNFD